MSGFVRVCDLDAEAHDRESELLKRALHWKTEHDRVQKELDEMRTKLRTYAQNLTDLAVRP